MKYLIAVRFKGKNEIWSFKTKKNRQLFIQDLKEFEGVEYATTQTYNDGTPYPKAKKTNKISKELQ